MMYWTVHPCTPLITEPERLEADQTLPHDPHLGGLDAVHVYHYPPLTRAV